MFTLRRDVAGKRRHLQQDITTVFKMRTFIILCILCVSIVKAKPQNNRVPRKFKNDVPGFSPGATRSACTDPGFDVECWGFVDVREGAHMFYWLYHTTHEDGYQNRPLVLWLQGGPGGSSTGYGNFEIIGPLDLDLEPRESTWIQSANVLFVDSPVGAGYSYVDSDSDFTRDVDEAAEDITTFMRIFIQQYPEFSTNPFYIFGQSYGGKMAVVFAQYFLADISAGNLQLNLQGVAMGNAWTHPVDSTTTWGGLLYWMSTVDDDGLAKIDAAAQLAADAVANGQFFVATDYWRATQQVVFAETNYVDFYNILKFLTFNSYNRTAYKVSPFGNKYDLILGPMEQRRLYDLMNGPIRQKLGIIPNDVTWDGQSDLVFFYQEGDFMKDVLYAVDDLLENTHLDVVVYQGQLDLICDTKGALDWVQRLTWSDLPIYNVQPRSAFTGSDGQTDLFVKAYNNFKFYWNLRAGHAVPTDMGEAALHMLNRILDDLDN